jgi:hypothetical protein
MNMSIVKNPQKGLRLGVGALVLVCGLVGGTHEAQAATVTQTDNLESGGWTFWASNASQGGGYFTTWSLAHSPSTIAFLYYSPSAGASDWLQAYRSFSTTVTPTSCSASVWLHGNGFPNHGSVEMLDTNTWTYIGSTAYSNVGTSSWVKYTVNNSSACTKNITVRVTMGTHPGSWEEVYVDDASISWNF